MKKLILFVFVAVLAASTVYVTRAYAGNDSDAKSTTATRTGGENADKVQCPKSADCPAQCSGCADYADKDKDGQCDKRQACHSGGARQGCPGHRGFGCSRRN